MTFSVAGSIITQANESGIAITAAASITGGVRFTCTQSYAAGNVVRITGTTSYNGNWMVADRTATTFDVLESAQGTAITFVSSQTGTAARGDASLAGISGLTGVTTTTLDASSGYVVYMLADNVKLQINGTLIIAGLRELNSRLGQNEQLVIGQNAVGTVQPIIRVGSGGVLVVGCRYTNTVNYTGTTAPQYTDTITPQVVIYQKGQYGRLPNDSDAQPDPAPASAFFAISSGGRFDWLSGTIDHWGQIGFNSGSTVNIGFVGARNKPVLDNRRCSTRIFFHPGSTARVFGLKIIGDRGINVGATDNLGRGSTLLMLQPPVVFQGYEPFWMLGSIAGANGNGVGGSYTIENYAGAFGTEVDFVKSVMSGQTLNVTFKNSAVGTTMTLIDNSLGTVLLYVTQSLAATVKTTAGVAIESAVVWTISNASVQSLGVTNASGQAVIDNIQTGFSPDNQASVTLRFAAGDVATWNVRAYQSLSAVYQVTMRGIGGSVVEPAMVNDSAVTLSRTAAGALSTINTLDQFYDAAKYWNVQSVNVNYPSATTQVATAAGTTLDLSALNVVVDATAASAFAVNTGTNTVTIKSATLAVGAKFSTLKTTGTISFANGADATCTLQGIVVRGAAGIYSPKLETATVRFTAAGTYDLRGATISGTLTLTNTSGGAVTVQLQPGVTFVNSGPSITVDNAASVTLTVNNIVAGSRIQIYNSTTATEIVNQVVTGTSFAYTYTETVGITNGDLIRVRLAYQNGITARVGFQTFGLASLSNWTILADQQTDTVYGGIGIDGSTVSEFSADYPNIQVDINDPDGVTTLSRLYAWFSYICTSADGIRNWLGGIIAEDNANFKIVTLLLNLRLDNVSASGVQFVGDIRLFRDDGAAPVVATTTGGGSITLYAGKVYVVSTGGSALTPSESAKLMGLPDSAANATAVLAAAAAAPIHADIRKVNAITVDGAGTEADPFGPV